jgi:DNA-binding SARP family transcriptional activator
MGGTSTIDASLQHCDHLVAVGDIDAALGALTALAGSQPLWPPELAWRIGLVHYLLRGSPRDALTSLSRGVLAEERTADEALLLGWLSAAYWALGDVDACADCATRAIAAAEAADDDRARAAAHVALAMQAMLTGDRVANAAHYTKALRLARASGDRVQEIRVLLNRSSGAQEEGFFDDALTDLATAVGLAEELGNPILLAVALTNEGDALSALGRLADAEQQLRRAVKLCQGAASGKICFALASLAEVLRRRGRPTLARAAYEEVIPLAEAHGHIQVLVPALAGLSIVLIDTDPVEALRVAARAVQVSVGPFTVAATMALARATLASGDRAGAEALAHQAQGCARTHRDRAGMATALELQAEVCAEPERTRRYLAEARSIWLDLGAGLDADRVTVALGRLPVVTSAAYADSHLAAERLAAAGLSDVDAAPAVEIRTLGRFEVLVGGRPVAPSAWQSRKARDLRRLLVARRGRAAHREELAELLWSDEGGRADRRGHRLATALSIVRGIVDGDRADSAVIADGSSVALDTSRVVVDLETFLHQADHALRSHRRGEPGACDALRIAERLYTGEFLEGEAYEDWAAGPRELARATYLHVVRTLADHAARIGDTHDAIRQLLRVLAMDAYDERGHLDLIAAYTRGGRHGEARRARDRYAAAMREIGIAVLD